MDRPVIHAGRLAVIAGWHFQLTVWSRDGVHGQDCSG